MKRFSFRMLPPLSELTPPQDVGNFIVYFRTRQRWAEIK
jgi:ATP-dependent phosphoenolpyruvate carboxykinase